MRNRRFEFDSASLWFGGLRGSHPTPPSSQECPGRKPPQRLAHLSLARCRCGPGSHPSQGFRGRFPDHGRCNHHENDDEHRLEGLDRLGLYLQPEQGPVQHLYGVRADDRTGDAELPAAQRVSAYCHGENRVHLDVLEQIDAVVAPRLGDRDETRDRGTDSENHVGQELDLCRVDAVQARGLLVDSHGLRVELEVRGLEEHGNERDEDDGQDYRSLYRHSRYHAADLTCQVVRQDGRQFAVNHEGDGPARREQYEGRDHWLNPEYRNQGTVECADDYPDHAAREEARQDGQPRDITGTQEDLDKYGGRNGAGHTHAYVLPARGRGNQGHAYRQDDQLRGAEQDVRYVPVQCSVDHGHAEVIGALYHIDHDEERQDREGEEQMRSACFRPGHAHPPPGYRFGSPRAITCMTSLCVKFVPESSPTISRSFMTINREQVRSISSISEDMNVTLTPSSASLSTSF